MANQRIALPYEYYPDPTRGRPVYFGSIYLGEVDKDPEVYPVQAYVAQENGPIVPIDQPLNTGAGGIILVNGSPAIIIVDGDYSLRVRDQNGAEVYYVANSVWSGSGGSGTGDFVQRIGDSMVGDLLMYNEAKTVWYNDQGATARAEVFTSNVALEGERSGIRLFDQYGNDGNTPGAAQELVSIRSENGADGILRSAVVAQRNLGTLSSAQQWHGLIGFNNVRENEDEAVFLLRGESDPFMSWFGTAWNMEGGLNTTQLRICRPAVDTTADYISLCNAVDVTPFFTVDPDGNVNIAAGATYNIDGVPTGGGVGEAPIDGSTYGRLNAGWVDISSVIAGDFLPYDGSLPFTGSVADLTIQNGTKFIWTDDAAGLVSRAEMIAEPIGVDATRRSGLRLFDIDGNDGAGVGDQNEELVSLRAQVNALTGANEAALVVQNNVGTSTSANGFNGIIGFNNVEDTANYAQFIIQGTDAEFPVGRDRRRAWFGTQWPSGPNPAGDGLESIQLYINRTTDASTSGMIDLRVADEQKFTVTDLGRVDAAGVVRAQGLSGGFTTGFGVEIYSNLATKEGIIRCYDADLAQYEKLFLAGDELDFRTTNNADDVVSNLKIWQNPATPTIDEVAIFNKAQLRQYADASGTAITFELYGTATTAYGYRVYQPGIPNFGIQVQSANGGVSTIRMRKPGNTGNDYGIEMTTADTGLSTIEVDGGFIATAGISVFNGLSMTDNGIDMNNHFIFNLSTPIVDDQAATKKYVDDAVGVGGGPYMDLATNQTVNGTKTFNDTIIADGISMLNNGIDMDNQVLFNPLDPTFSNHVGDRGYNDGRYVLGSASGFINTTSSQSASGAKTWNSTATFNGTGNTMNGLSMTSNGLNMNSRTLFNPANPTASNAVGDRAYNDGRYTLSSDMRLKKDVDPMQDALDLVASLRTFSYEYNDVMPVSDMKTGRRYGISAQEIQDAFPLAALDNPSNAEYLVVDTDQLIPVLIKAIQELNEKVAGLQ